MMNTQLVWTV